MSKAKTENRTVEELNGALVCLNYEVEMLRSLVNILTNYQDTGVINNALLESFLIHARILIEFLYKDCEYKDTVRASHYFTPYSLWESIRPSKTKLLEETEEDAHKLLAHLTYARLERKTKWAYTKIENDIQVALKVFRENLPDYFTKESNV